MFDLGDADPEHASNPEPTDHHGGLSFGVAGDMRQVVDAWRLVYKSYLANGLIHPNPARLHTVRQAITGESAVVCGSIDRVVVSTFSVYLDGADGIPLDSVYGDYFAHARDHGVVPLEFGLFADRRQHLYRSINAMIQMMRYAVYFGIYTKQATDGFLGVHPRHVRFWTRLFGFEVVGEQRHYPVVRDNPVVLLRYDWYRKIQNADKLARGVAQIINNPVEDAEFDARCRLSLDSVAGTPIQRFLECDRAVV